VVAVTVFFCNICYVQNANAVYLLQGKPFAVSYGLRRSFATGGVAGSNQPGDMDFRLVFVVFCVGSGLCDELIAHLEEGSY
jgi:hypothetical protein